MPSPDWERLDDFLSTDDFAITAKFTSDETGRARLVSGIFDEQYVNADLGEYSMDTGQPRFMCKECDVVGLKKHDECTFAKLPGVKFELTHDPLPDGVGMATVLLGRVYD